MVERDPKMVSASCLVVAAILLLLAVLFYKLGVFGPAVMSLICALPFAMLFWTWDDA